MKVKYRIYGATVVMIGFIGATIFMLMQKNWQELWVGMAFTGAFACGMYIYIRSNMTERKRLQTEKDKHKRKKK